jgi:hypothetical protein
MKVPSGVVVGCLIERSFTLDLRSRISQALYWLDSRKAGRIRALPRVWSKFVKKWSLFLLAVLAFGGVVAAQEPQDLPANPEMQRQELVNLEKENARAVQLHNPTFFKSVYSDDFHGVSRYGETIGKAALIRELEQLSLDFESVVSSDAQVRMFRDAAYVLSLRSEVGHANGKRFYNQFRILRVYVNTPRGWKIVSQLETKLSER